jgi:hypothetical protein
VDPSAGPKVVGKFNSVVEAKKLIKDSFNDMYDTGDHLRNVAPGIYVLEEDYRNTGEKATANNYKHFYHWIIQTSQGVTEAETDFFKRRQRERKVDAGQPVAKQRQPKMTDYQKKRAQDKKEMELGETTNYWTRLQNERNTKIASLVSELTESVKDIK